MKKSWIVATRLLLLAALLVPWSRAQAATDGIYVLTKQQDAGWEGTSASRLAAPSTDYDFAYGDEATVTYTLPWSFTFYGLPYGQITADTNGNIWFGATGSASSFNLASNDRGPVIAAWNNDQSSYLTGGVFIQHKTNPERVVIEWQAETYTDEGQTVQPNNFEVVLFPNGDIRIDYKTFTAVNAKDFGSGISSNDGTHYLSLTSSFQPVYQLAGNSYGITTHIASLQVNISGTGSGTVTSTPVGIACNTKCSSTFPASSQITLHPEAVPYSIFTGWSNGTCTGLADCLLTLSADVSVTAGFDRDTAHQVYVPGLSQPYFSTLQEAYNAAVDGSVIKVWATTYTESVDCNRNISVTLQGGFDSGYTMQQGVTILQGALNVSNGTVITDDVELQ